MGYARNSCESGAVLHSMWALPTMVISNHRPDAYEASARPLSYTGGACDSDESRALLSAALLLVALESRW
ncbi:hypothetical protein PC116_g12948 [Phytophthora cactorum]|nr:hypothetical protein PC119_g18429 [Phytophthora cactorum]KAG3132428.1 hypothetical protein C6341_g22913 [Phytophthora cactorum]KAG4239032.1 hypothetical protein PC116_g12948 [Phytophthora cactorum]